MFTGLIEEVGTIVSRGGTEVVDLTVAAPNVSARLAVGASIAVSGVCLTATRIQDGTFSTELVPETQHRTTLGSLRQGSQVNLELPMEAGGRFGGHIVSGHIDGTAEVIASERSGGDVRFTVALRPELARYVVEKGSVALDGVSLTVAERDAASFVVALIPHTLARTTLGSIREGDRVNVEVDILAKYVEQLLGASS